jgi:hypothetical protein
MFISAAQVACESTGTPATDSVPVTPQDTSSTGNADTTTTPKDNGTPGTPDTTSTGTETATETVDTTPSEGSCPPEIAHTVKMGGSCTKSCECFEGTVCYNEAYMKGYRFCTRKCNTGDGSSTCNQGAGIDPKDLEAGEAYTCTAATTGPKYKKEPYNLTLVPFCVPKCKYATDCAKFNGPWDACSAEYPGDGFTYWFDSTVASPSCVVKQWYDANK